ncbi:hypothetical protein DPMN_089103 [Dreissena polymorpha]|uniref:Uncharacterized protein n=1 Tax=Dreissena polymorpha TaxID=45954 RepID=A0A9D4QX08_DREPO|nr:hypothetical protein DPMN_089103 [Dreissena polymorpha]
MYGRTDGQTGITTHSKTNVLTKFHKDWTTNVTSRVLTGKNNPPSWRLFLTNVLTKFHEDWTINLTSRPYKETAMHPGSHYFQIVQDIIGTHVLTKFHED